MDEPDSKRPKSVASGDMEISDGQRKAVLELELVDLEDNPLKIDSVEPLSEDRRAYYASTVEGFPGPADERAVASVHCSNDEFKVEHIVVIKPTEPYEPEPIVRDDAIMFEEVPLSSLIQYRFSPDKPWLLGSISVESLVFYRQSKFQIWKEMLMKGGNGCLRAFRSMLRTGLITDIFDPVCLASPPEEADDWKVEDPKKPGTFVDIPRSVHEIRVWDPETRAYTAVETRMEGAPAPGTEDKYWADLLDELRAFHGAEVVDEALNGSK
eukprot:m.57613 g.57613  ORF g.57613 m.57613 type:complete len:268 (-) comp7776_c0_seq2:1441-2244(-)